MASTTAPFQNIYYQRAVATAKSCFICHRSTTIVLATMSTTDFLYTCETHLSDPGFATPLPPSNPAPLKLSDAEIAKIKEEWEEKQRLKKAKEADKSKDKDVTDKGKDSPNESPTTKPPIPSVPPAPTPATPGASSHARFALHREIFAMRQMEHRKRRQAARVKQVAPMLPSVPRT